MEFDEELALEWNLQLTNWFSNHRNLVFCIISKYWSIFQKFPIYSPIFFFYFSFVYTFYFFKLSTTTTILHGYIFSTLILESTFLF